MKITHGNRVTLTYNLHYGPGVGDLAGNSPVLDAQSLPLYQEVKQALGDPKFMPKGAYNTAKCSARNSILMLLTGGYLGVFCSHAYAHNTVEGGESLPAVLKGTDMAVYSVFQALGLDAKVCNVLDKVNDSDEEDGGGEKSIYRNYNRVGKLGQLKTTYVGRHDDYDWYDILEAFSRDETTVDWLTDPPTKYLNPGFVHLTVSTLRAFESRQYDSV